MFPPGEHPDLLVGLGEPDDAAIYRLDPPQALVVRADFFTPIVDSDYDFGAIAAANSLSLVCATGGPSDPGIEPRGPAQRSARSRHRHDHHRGEAGTGRGGHDLIVVGA